MAKFLVSSGRKMICFSTFCAGQFINIGVTCYAEMLFPFLQQLAIFRTLLCTEEGEAAASLLSNHRPPQPLRGRKVRASFQ